MGRYRTLEVISTKFLGATAIVTIALVVAAYSLVVREHWADVDKLAKFTDAVFKTVALLLGTLWAVNRYFVERTDAPQFRSIARLHSRGFDWTPHFSSGFGDTGKTPILERLTILCKLKSPQPATGVSNCIRFTVGRLTDGTMVAQLSRGLGLPLTMKRFVHLPQGLCVSSWQFA